MVIPRIVAKLVRDVVDKGRRLASPSIVSRLRLGAIRPRRPQNRVAERRCDPSYGLLSQLVRPTLRPCLRAAPLSLALRVAIDREWPATPL